MSGEQVARRSGWKKRPESSFHRGSLFRAENSGSQRKVISLPHFLLGFCHRPCHQFMGKKLWHSPIFSFFHLVGCNAIRLFFNIHLLSCIFVTHVPTRPLNPHTDLLCSSGWTQLFTGLLPRQNFSRPRSAALTHLQMRRSFFSGFLTKMELKRWKTHRPSHSLCKQREWSEDKAVAK